MRAVVQETFGGPEVLKIREVPSPSALPTELVVRVKAVGINPVEIYIRSGRFPLIGQPPFILGWDISGVVESVVPGTNRFAVGDEVFGMPLFPRPANAYAELVAAPCRQLSRKPRTLDHVHAAALPLAGLTAWQSLVDVASVSSGNRVLVHAGGGGVGHIAVQIAKARGAYVIATASADKRAFVQSLGVDEIVDYRRVDFSTTVHDIDVVLETVGGDYGERSLKTLRPGGLLVTIVDRLNERLAAKTKEAGFRFAGVSVEPDHVGLEQLTRLVEDGKLRIHVERTFPLEQAGEAHNFLATSPKGKVVLTVF
jgi:NADPH:quinone reductase-like Zn-dependent oxidoreductase